MFVRRQRRLSEPLADVRLLGLHPPRARAAGTRRATADTLHGEIDKAFTPLLQTALERLALDTYGDVIADLSDVRFLGATGVNFLAAVANWIVARGHTVAVTACAPIATAALRACGLVPPFIIAS